MRYVVVKWLRILAIAVFVVAMAACAGQRNRENVRQGLLVSGTPQQAFQDVWGVPDRTSTMAGGDRTEAGWGGGRGYFFRGQARYDVWEYSSRGVVLVFERARLATWKTDKTTSELRSKD